MYSLNTTEENEDDWYVQFATTDLDRTNVFLSTLAHLLVGKCFFSFASQGPVLCALTMLIFHPGFQLCSFAR